MSRTTVKNAVRLSVFLAAVATAACSDFTAPTSTVGGKKKALKDSTILGDTTGICRSGWTVQLGRWTCADER